MNETKKRKRKDVRCPMRKEEFDDDYCPKQNKKKHEIFNFVAFTIETYI